MQFLICESFFVLHAEDKPMISLVETMKAGVRHKVHCSFKIF